MLPCRKTDEAVWKPPLSKGNPTPLSTNPPISEQFFHDPPLCPNFKNQKRPLILGVGGVGEETMNLHHWVLNFNVQILISGAGNILEQFELCVINFRCVS